MYINDKGEEIRNPDPNSGLYIRSRRGRLVKASIPSDHLIFQIGETAQIHSGGFLQATPHCVRGAEGPQAYGVSRETFAVFMEPMWMEKMDVPNGTSLERVTEGSSGKYLPRGVPSLSSRWTDPSMSFAEFTTATLKSYY